MPAFAAEAFTAYNRVHADKHYADEDMLASAAIGIVAAEIFTKPRKDLSVSPLPGKGTYGLIVLKRF